MTAAGFSRTVPLSLSGSDREAYNQPAPFLPQTSQQNPSRFNSRSLILSAPCYWHSDPFMYLLTTAGFAFLAAVTGAGRSGCSVPPGRRACTAVRGGGACSVPRTCQTEPSAGSWARTTVLAHPHCFMENNESSGYRQSWRILPHWWETLIYHSYFHVISFH